MMKMKLKDAMFYNTKRANTNAASDAKSTKLFSILRKEIDNWYSVKYSLYLNKDEKCMNRGLSIHYPLWKIIPHYKLYSISIIES